MADPGAEGHWQDVYGRREPAQVSWFEPVPATSLAWITKANLPADAAILDAGGGVSTLAGELVGRGYGDVTVADISTSAIERAKTELGGVGERITWIQADLRSHGFDRRYDLWHDRAVFHFMVDDGDRDGYLAVLHSAIRPGGHLILATFGPEGPTECSNLPVQRYSAEQLSDLLAVDFKLIDSQLTTHRTPSDLRQQFLYAHFRRSAEEGEGAAAPGWARSE
jgi:SAM-dependent methyltransferase